MFWLLPHVNVRQEQFRRRVIASTANYIIKLLLLSRATSDNRSLRSCAIMKCHLTLPRSLSFTRYKLKLSTPAVRLSMFLVVIFVLSLQCLHIVVALAVRLLSLYAHVVSIVKNTFIHTEYFCLYVFFANNVAFDVR